MRSREGQSLRVAVLARSVYPLHRYRRPRTSRLRSRALPAGARRPRHADHASCRPQTGRLTLRADAVFRHPNLTMRPVPYTTFPFANSRGTTILDRSTAYPLFGLRAGRLAARLASAGEHRHRPRAGRQRARLCVWQIRPRHARAARLQSAGARRIRRHRSVASAAEAARRTGRFASPFAARRKRRTASSRPIDRS